MNLAIKWAVCPDATHYLPSGFGPSLSSFWRLVDGVPVERWSADGVPETNHGFKQEGLCLEGLFDRLIERPKIDFSKAPEGATHFLLHQSAADIAWFRVAAGVSRWFPFIEAGAGIYGWSPINCLPPMSEAIPSTRRGPDWSKAPEGATHWVVSARERVPTGWYRADGNKMRCIAQEGEYLFRLDDVQHADSGLTLIERPATEPAPFSPDWATAPDNATHHYGESSVIHGESIAYP